MQIRKATEKDMLFIVNSQIQMAVESEGLILDFDVVSKGVKHIFDFPEIGYYLIAAEAEQPVGVTLILKEWSDWRNGNVLWIHSLYVIPSHRKLGIFKKLYQVLKEEVENSESVRGLRLYVEKNNKIAQAAYNRVGMTNEHYELFEWLKE